MEQTVLVFSHHVLAQTDILPMYLEILTEHGFIIKSQKYIHTLTPTQATNLHPVIDTNDDAAPLALPVCALHVTRVAAVETAKQLISTHVLKNTYSSATQYNALRDVHDYFTSSSAGNTVEHTVVVLKPGYTTDVYAGVVEVLHKQQYVVLGKNVCILSAEQAAFITSDSAELTHLTSDVSVVLLVEKVGAVNDMCLLMGPNDPVEARQNNSTTLRALYGGADVQHNMLYTPATWALAQQLIGQVFVTPLPVERSVVVLKPSGEMSELINQYNTLFKQYGIAVISTARVQLSKLRAEQYLQPHRGDNAEQWADLVKQWTAGELYVYMVEKVACIDTLAKLISSSDSTVYTSTAETAAADINQFFTTAPAQHLPGSADVAKLLQTRATPCSKSLSDVLVAGLTALCRIRPSGDDAVLWLADWLEKNNPYQPQTVHAGEFSDAKSVIGSAVTQDDDENNSVADISDKHVTFITGAPYTNISALSKQSVDTSKYELIDATAVFKSLSQQQNAQADTLHSYISTHRPIPAELATTILQRAIGKAAKKNVVVCNYPHSQDQVFVFERQCVKPARVVVVDSTLDGTVVRGTATGADKSVVKQKYGTYRDEMVLVGEHYAQFNQAVRVQYDGGDAGVVQRLKQALQ